MHSGEVMQTGYVFKIRMSKFSGADVPDNLLCRLMRKAKPPNHSAGRGRHRARSVQNTPPARQDASTRRAVTLRQSSVDESVE